MGDVEENRKYLLTFINHFKEVVERATDLEGNWKVEKPSIHPVYQNPLPPVWGGVSHTRFTLTVDVIDPRPLASKVKEDEK